MLAGIEGAARYFALEIDGRLFYADERHRHNRQQRYRKIDSFLCRLRFVVRRRLQTLERKVHSSGRRCSARSVWRKEAYLVDKSGRRIGGQALRFDNGLKRTSDDLLHRQCHLSSDINWHV